MRLMRASFTPAKGLVKINSHLYTSNYGVPTARKQEDVPGPHRVKGTGLQSATKLPRIGLHSPQVPLPVSDPP